MSAADADLVREMIGARDECRAYRPPSEQGRRLDLAEAYRLQDGLREALVARGERVAGWKVGLTTRAGQEAYQVSEPVSAFLLASGVLVSGVEVPAARFVAPGVEAEVAFVMRRDLAGPGVTAVQATVAVEGALPALELIDFRHRAKAIVLGGALTSVTGLDLALEGLVYEQSGAVVGTATAAEVMGHPWRRWPGSPTTWDRAASTWPPATS